MSAPAAALLEARGLRVERGGATVLDLASFRLEDGERVCLFGPNGSGKTTLLHALLGLLPRSAGAVAWRGREVRSRGEALALRRRVALVQQEPLLFDTSVAENVASGLRIRGAGAAEIRAAVGASLERFGLAHLAGRDARKLSGGEARRVSLARALATGPEAVLLDEPFSNLDAPARQAVTDDLERSLRDSGVAAILVTHDRADALRLCDRMVVLRGGRIVQSASPSEVMNAPADEFIAASVGMDAILPGTVERCAEGELTVAVAGAHITALGDAAAGATVFCCIRPENVTLEAADPGHGTSARNVYRARVTGVISLGPYLKVQVDCGFPVSSYVTPESIAALGLRAGREVFASFKATSVHVIHHGGR